MIQQEDIQGGQCSSYNQEAQQQQQQLLLLQQQQQQMRQQQNCDNNNNIFGGGSSGRSGFNNNNMLFPSGEVSPMLQVQPWSMPMPPVHPFNNHIDPFVNIIPPQQQQPSSSVPYANLFNRRVNVPNSLQFAYHHHDGSSNSHHHLRILSDTLQHGCSAAAAPFGLQAELGKMSAQEIMEAKALAASKSHSEAERRRRERINNHLAKLRSLLPNTTKTDKASLLAEVIQHVKELKRQTSLIAETSPVPTECDELTVDDAADEDGKPVIKASLCCDDRSDLLPELIKTLKALRLRTLRAEITTLGGRVKNVLFITGEEDSTTSSSGGEEQHHGQHQQQQYYNISSIQEALRAVMEKSVGDESASGTVKRQRTNIISIS